MTLIEVTVAMFILFVALGATLGTISTFSALEQSNRESTVAQIAARSALEQLQATSFAQIFATFNTDPNDDPAGVGTAPGPGFAVAGLDPQDGDPDGLVGRIMLPFVPGAPTVLRENLVDPSFGLPRDLDGDGAVDGGDRAGDYLVLPVRIRIEWTGPSGNRSSEVQALIASR